MRRNSSHFLPTGALLKLSSDENEITAKQGELLFVPLSISRSPQLTESIRLELCDDAPSMFSANPQELAADQRRVEFQIDVETGGKTGEHLLKIRATA